MGCHYFECNGVRGYLSIRDCYYYKGFYFEFHPYLGPTKLRKDGELAKKIGRKFCKVVGEWEKLSKRQKEKTRI